MKLKKLLAGFILTLFSLAVMGQWYDFIGNLQFDTAAVKPAHTEGMMFYNGTTKSVGFYTDNVDRTVNLATHMNWKGDWVAGAYNEYDTVHDLEWTMIANKNTEERPAPVPTGEPKDVFIGDMDSAQVTAKQVLYGQRYSNAQGVFINSYRVSTVAGNTYRVFSVKDPLGAPIITELVSFEANSSAWRTFNITPILLKANTTFDLVVMGTEPDPTPTTFTGSWNYLKPTNPAVPIAGEAIHSSKDSDTIDINKTDDIAGDRSAELQALTIGDKIALDGTEWAIQATVDNTTYMTFTVAPASQSILTGVQSFTFETVTATPLTYGTKVDHWLSNANISGLYIADGDYDNIVSNDNAYSVDLNVTEADISEDWDVVAAGATAGSANPIVPFTVTETITRSGVTTQNTFPNVVYNDASTLITETPSYGRTTYTFLRDATISSTVVGGSATGAGDRYATLTLFNSAGTTKLVSTSNTAGSEYSLTASMNTKVSAGDFLQGTVGIDAANSVYTSFSVTATAQSSGTVFATDSSKEDIVVQGRGNNGEAISGGVTDITWNEVSDNTNSWSGTQFTVPEKGIYNISGRFQLTGASAGATELRVGGALVAYIAYDAVNKSYHEFNVEKEFNKDEVISIRYTGTATLSNADQNYHYINITKQSVNVDNLIIENFGTVVAASTLGTGELENVFSAKIDTNGSLISKSGGEFLGTIVRNGAGDYRVNYATGFFTEKPSVVLTHFSSTGNLTISTETETSEFCIVRVQISNSGTLSLMDSKFSITLTRQGTNYKSKANYIDSLIIENYDGETDLDSFSASLDTNNDVNTVHKALTTSLVVVDDSTVANQLRIVNNSTEKLVINAHAFIESADAGANTYSDARWFNSNGNTLSRNRSVDLNVSSSHASNAGANVILSPNDYIYFLQAKSSFDSAGVTFTVWKPAKKLGVDQLGQVVTNHVTGGTEYELKGQLWNGKQIYARSWEDSGLTATSIIALATLDPNLRIISSEVSFKNNFNDWYDGARTFNTTYGVYLKYSAGGSVVLGIENLTVVDYFATLKYIKL